jgi:cathepsin L
MFKIAAVCALGCLAVATAVPVFTFNSNFLESANAELANEFAAFKATYNKVYQSAEHEAERFAVFIDNFNFIRTHQGDGYTVGINEFADMTHEEFKAKYLGYKPSTRVLQKIWDAQDDVTLYKVSNDECGEATLDAKYEKQAEQFAGLTEGTCSSVGYTVAAGTKTLTVPVVGQVTVSVFKKAALGAADDSVDWTTKGAVTPVKNQAQCGSCWAFSATGALEGAIFLQDGVLESLSEQELVSCDKVDSGCNGGAMDNAFTFAEKNGLALESQYPYTSGTGNTGTCQTAKESPAAPHSKGSKFTDVTPNSEAALKAAVAQRPVSVAIEADKQAFQFYTSGIIKATAGCGTNLDHGVLAVGYGVDGTTLYWKVKNSWGATWGDKGFVRLERTESSSSKGTCGIAMDASYPTVA